MSCDSRYVALLSDADLLAYNELHDALSQASKKYRRHQRMTIFVDGLMRIKRFCHKGDKDDWKRFLVCGLCWVSEHVLAVNNQRLMSLMGRSKSTINDVLTKMHYKSVPINKENENLVTEMIPFLGSHPEELRQWTLRRAKEPWSRVERTAREEHFLGVDHQAIFEFDLPDDFWA